MPIDFEVTEHRPVAGPALTLVKAEFRPVPGEPVHSNIFHMQLYPTGRRLLTDGLGRFVTESGIIVPPLPDDLFPDENPADPFRRETFARDNDAEMVKNIEAYWERKLQAAAEGRPWPRHHRSTLNLQVGASGDDAIENVATTVVTLTTASQWFGDFGFDAHIGLFFSGVSGLSGATIDSATLTFRASATDSGAFVGDWYAEDVESPVTFVAVNEDISGRTRTTTTCGGDGSDFGNWTTGSDHTFTGPSPSIKGIIQELADTHDPSAIALVHIFGSGTGERRMVVWDTEPSLGPKLDIDFTAGGASLLPRYGHPMRHLIGR